jgi:adenosylhomocysteine nucleosidase
VWFSAPGAEVVKTRGISGGTAVDPHKCHSLRLAPKLLKFFYVPLMLLVAMSAPSAAGTRVPATARTAILCAFEPEWTALIGLVKHPQTRTVEGVRVVSGTLEGQSVVLMLSGVSMVNAASTTQFLIDHFSISRIVFSGIAGGVDPILSIGDVIVPERWIESMELTLARATPDGFTAPAWMPGMMGLPGYGMMLPRGVRVGSAHRPEEYRNGFGVDAGLFALARSSVGSLVLKKCTATQACLNKAPKVVIGGTGVSGPAFVDNKEYREYLYTTFHAGVTDMESAAVAQVAFRNEIPFIVFRSVSDLAGGDASTNQMNTFMQLAAENSASVVKAFIRALH